MGPAPGTNRDQIKPNRAIGVNGMVPKKDGGSLGKALLLRWSKGFQGLLERASRLHLGNDEKRAPPQHQIKLAKRCSVPFGKDAKTTKAAAPGRELFSPSAMPLRSLTCAQAGFTAHDPSSRNAKARR